MGVGARFYRLVDYYYKLPLGLAQDSSFNSNKRTFDAKKISGIFFFQNEFLLLIYFLSFCFYFLFHRRERTGADK